MSNQSNQQISDLLVPAGTIQHFAEVGLDFDELPVRREELVALSIRMDAAFMSCWEADLKSLAEEHDEIPGEVAQAVMNKTVQDFIQRYGVLALFSTYVIRVFWDAQRPKCQAGPKRLRQLGQNLAIFALGFKDSKTKKSIGMPFKINKPTFLIELNQLSRDLGASEPDQPRARHLIELVKTGDYPMLKQNLRLLEEFLQYPDRNPDLNDKNSITAEMLAQYGIGKQLGERRNSSMTPNQFYYTWIAWATNKKRSTVRREIQTAAARSKAWVNKLIRGTKNR